MFSCCWPWIMCLGVFFIYTSLRHDVFLLRAIRKKWSLNLLTFTLTELLCASLKKRHRNHIPSYQVYTSTSNNWFVFSFWPGGGNFGACRCLVLSSTSLCRVLVGWWDVCVWGHSNRNVTITTTYCCRAAPTIYIYALLFPSILCFIRRLDDHRKRSTPCRRMWGTLLFCLPVHPYKHTQKTFCGAYFSDPPAIRSDSFRSNRQHRRFRSLRG